MDRPLDTTVLVQGTACVAPALVLTSPISFWGCVDPASGMITATNHPQNGQYVGGCAVFLPATIGSSSGSSVLLELVHSGNAPAALVLHQPDAILLLGLIVAREMGWKSPPAVALDRAHFPSFDGFSVCINADGRIRRIRGDQ